MIKTKKRGDYEIVTFAIRGELLEWLKDKPKKSELIRNLLIKEMKKDKRNAN